MLKLPSKLKFQKKYIAFFTVVPLLVITALIKVDCPVCYGEGTISIFRGMENVRIEDIQWKESYFTQDICGFYFLYEYEVLLSLANDVMIQHQDMLNWF